MSEKTEKRQKLEGYILLGLKQADAAKLTGTTRQYAGLVAHELGVKPIFKHREKLPCGEEGCRKLLNPYAKRVTGMCKKHSHQNTRAEAIRQLGVKGLGVADIGKKLGVPATYAWTVLNRSGFKLPKRTQRECTRCGKGFSKPRSSARRVCSECKN